MLDQIYIILRWTLLGFAAAYIFMSIFSFTHWSFGILVTGGMFAPWVITAFAISLAMGFLVGLFKAGGLVK